MFLHVFDVRKFKNEKAKFVFNCFLDFYWIIFRFFKEVLSGNMFKKNKKKKQKKTNKEKN